jgi:hypothetical protein
VRCPSGELRARQESIKQSEQEEPSAIQKQEILESLEESEEEREGASSKTSEKSSKRAQKRDE